MGAREVLLEDEGGVASDSRMSGEQLKTAWAG
jgi:hypothetical protein